MFITGLSPTLLLSVFFFNDTATTEIYTLSLHDALPISARRGAEPARRRGGRALGAAPSCRRSEEHTSELQSRFELVCRLLLEKKKFDATLCIAMIRALSSSSLSYCISSRKISTGFCRVFFFNDTATTEIYTLSLHDALPI